MDFYTSCVRLGNHIHVRGYKKGKRVHETEPYQPVLFQTTNDDSTFKTLDGTSLEPIIFDSINHARNKIQNDKDHGQYSLYGMQNFVTSYICERWPDDIPYDVSLIRIGYLDIEVASDEGFPHPEHASHEVISITLKVGATVLVWGLKPFETDRDDVIYKHCETEKQLLADFLNVWKKLDMDVVTGWNIDTFDIPYLVNRIHRLFSFREALKLSPLRVIMERKRRMKHGQEALIYDLSGLQVIDYLRTYQKLCLKQRENYKLNTIANVELEEAKIDYSEYRNLAHLYKEDHDKFIRYNINDVEIIERLEVKLRYLSVVFSLAYTAHVNYDDTFAQTRIWDALIYNYLIKKNIVVPPHREHVDRGAYEGAFVKDPKVGLHRWIVGFDLTSLYPSLIMQYNISPDTIVDGERQNFRIEDVIAGAISNDSDFIMTANGYHFRKTNGFMTEIVKDIFKKRQYHKKKMVELEGLYNKTKDKKYEKESIQHKSMQETYKVVANSCYGTMGTPYFRFYDVRLAEAITKSGQLSILWIMDKVNKYLNKVCGTKGKDFIIAGDTDSIYITLDTLVQKFFPDTKNEKEILDFVEELSNDKLSKVITKEFKALSNVMGCPENFMAMKRETISDKGFWTAKKRYVLNTRVDESGYLPEPKIKITGIEVVKSSFPQVSRETMKASIKLILDNDQTGLWKMIAETKAKYDTLPVEDISIPRGVNAFDKYKTANHGVYAKGITIQARAALNYNGMIDTLGLNTKYEAIKEGDKIKFCYLTLPNPIRQNVIGFPFTFPPEFNLDRFVDRDQQYEKTFYEPLRRIVDKVGLKMEKVANIKKFLT